MNRWTALTVLLGVVCLTGPTWAAATFVIETVENSGLLGHASLALDAHGHPRICYHNYNGDKFTYASKDGCVWSLDTIGVFAEVEPTALALDAQGNPHVSFYVSQTNTGLKYATSSLGAWTVEQVDPTPDDGYYHSIAVDGLGVPHISYFLSSGPSTHGLRYATRTAGTWTSEVVDMTGDAGQYNSLALDAAGNPHISYYDRGNGDLKYASRTQGVWTIETVDPDLGAPGGQGSRTSLALDAQGHPYISYFDQIHSDLKLASRPGGSWAIETVDAAVVTGGLPRNVSLALDGQGNPGIAYSDATNDALKYASRTAGSWTLQVVDTQVSGHYESCLARDGQGRPSIAYSHQEPGGYSIRYAGPPNQPPVCPLAVASPQELWPADHKYQAISISGVTDPDGDPVTITVTGVTQDEPLNTRGDGNTCPDALITDGQASVRAERNGSPGIPGNGRVYAINFTASDGRCGVCEGTVNVCVPPDQGPTTACVDDGQRYNSVGPCTGSASLSPEMAQVALSVAAVTATQATVEFALPADTRVELAVFDVAGRRLATVENGLLAAGVYQRTWDIGGATKGLYYLRLRAGGVTLTKTVVKVH